MGFILKRIFSYVNICLFIYFYFSTSIFSEIQRVDAPTPPLVMVQFLEELSGYIRVLKQGSALWNWSHDSLIHFQERVRFM
jgi:hypothetical protein